MGSLPKTLPPCVAANLSAAGCESSADSIRLNDIHQNGAILPFQDSDLFDLQFYSRCQLCSGEDIRPAYQITFHRPEGEHQPFPPGSALGVVCPNVPADIEATLKLLDLTGDEYVDVTCSGTDPKVKTRFARSYAHVPAHCTVRYLFEYVLDLRTVLKKAFVKVLGDCCPEGSADRKILHELSSINQDEYRSEILEGRMMIFDLLKKFPTCRPSLAVLIEHLARLSPRFYSIANHSGKEIKFIYRPMEFKSLGRRLIGQCSTMFDLLYETSNDIESQLENLILTPTDPVPRNRIRCYLRKNVRNFSFPIQMKVPFIFACHGTGVAPFLAYVHWLRDNRDTKPPQGWLFYGCRYAERDALIKPRDVRESGFRIQLRQSRADVTTASDSEIQHGYAQDGLLQYADDVRKTLIENAGEVLICGDFQTMVKDTLGILGDILGAETVDALLKQNRIKLDVWT